MRLPSITVIFYYITQPDVKQQTSVFLFFEYTMIFTRVSYKRLSNHKFDFYIKW